MDIFTIHGVGGIIGNLLIGIFAERRFGELDGGKMVYGGAVQGEPLFAYQLLATVVIMAWSFVMTWIILVIISKIPGMELGLGKAEQQMGVDASEMGETTYDYVKALNIGRTKTRDFGTWTGQKQSKNLFKKE